MMRRAARATKRPLDRRHPRTSRSNGLFGLMVLALTTTSLIACEPSETEETPIIQGPTFRAIGGVSMGAMGASMIGTRHPEHFDAIGGLGAPMDFAYLLHKMRTQFFGGFCTYEELLAIMEAHPDDPDILDDREVIDACVPEPEAHVDWEFVSHFNHLPFDDNGGRFDRSSYIDKFEDLALALGNPLYFNPESPFYPPRTHGDWTCEVPIVIPGYANGGTAPFYHAEYNPEGRFDVITFCDGQKPVVVCDATGAVVDYCAAESAEEFCGEDGPPIVATSRAHPDAYYAEMGRHDPCRPSTRRMRIALAVDLNANGKRDYGEPIIHAGQERFEDVGVGSDPEPYHWLDNPLGTVGNFMYDEGEPFLDYGLDGLPGTGDFGEDTGEFSVSPNIENYFAHDPRANIRSWPEQHLAGTDVYLDGGVRDIMNFGLTAGQIFGSLSALTGDNAAWYDGFESLPSYSGRWSAGFDFRDIDWPEVPRNVFLRYGKMDATQAEIRQGDGGHVGTNMQAVDRVATFLGWVGARWRTTDFEPAQLSKNDAIEERSFYSESLGSERVYGIALPPGYADPANADVTYPVLYFLHGYGMGPASFLGSNLMFSSNMASGTMGKMIMVYGDGRCCHVNSEDGARDCYAPLGKRFPAPWRMECNRGSFYVNRTGFTPGDDTPYEESIFDLMRHVESTYRVAVPDWARLD